MPPFPFDLYPNAPEGPSSPEDFIENMDEYENDEYENIPPIRSRLSGGAVNESAAF
jgi:hypothetical protein